jgi:hypothetical protein
LTRQRTRSTPRAHRLGAASLVSLGIAVLMVAVFWYEPPPRWSVLIPLGLAVLLAGGWAMASHAAERVPDPENLPADSPGTDLADPPPIPAELPFPKRQAGLVTCTYLVFWTPFAVALAVTGISHVLGTGSEGPGIAALLLTIALGLLALFESQLWAELLGRTVHFPYTQLRFDAAAGRLRAIRVRVDTAVTDRRPYGSRVRGHDVHGTYLALTPHGGGPDGAPPEELRFGPMEGMYANRDDIARRHFSDSVPLVTGENAWLCWPKNWEGIYDNPVVRSRVMPTVLVTDGGHIVWGRTGEHEWVPRLRGGSAPLGRTDPGRTVTPAPQLSRWDPSATPGLLLALVPGVALTVLCLTGTLTGWAAVGVAAAMAPYLLFVSAWSSAYEGPGEAWWTVRDEEE